jgi:hypothetical protein
MSPVCSTVLLSGCPAWPLPQCPYLPCRGRGCPQCRGRAGCRCPVGRVRCPRVRTAGLRPRRPGLRDQRSRASATCAALRWCRMGGCGLPPSSRPGSRTPWPVSGGCGTGHSGRRGCPVLLPEPRSVSGRLVSGRLVSGRLDGVRTIGCPPRTLPQPVSVRGYRNRSSGRPLVWCRQRRDARASWRWSRSASWART